VFDVQFFVFPLFNFLRQLPFIMSEIGQVISFLGGDFDPNFLIRREGNLYFGERKRSVDSVRFDILKFLEILFVGGDYIDREICWNVRFNS
jgi:hypothetical protein